MQQSSKEIKAQCTCVLENKGIVAFVGASNNPSTAYDMVFAKNKDISIAKTGRWLAVLRRDYLVKYHKLIPIQPSHVSKDKAQTEKEKNHATKKANLNG